MSEKSNPSNLPKFSRKKSPYLMAVVGILLLINVAAIGYVAINSATNKPTQSDSEVANTSNTNTTQVETASTSPETNSQAALSKEVFDQKQKEINSVSESIDKELSNFEEVPNNVFDEGRIVGQ